MQIHTNYFFLFTLLTKYLSTAWSGKILNNDIFRFGIQRKFIVGTKRS